METWQRTAFRYTPYFCEENIWWLARALLDEGIEPGQLEVLLFSNPSRSVVLRNQRLAPPGEMLQWDYHVVLLCRCGDGAWIFDFDSDLDFPTDARDYLRSTFPNQAALPPHLRGSVRRIPADAYLRRFGSDRGHMRGTCPESAFPPYPPIEPADARDRIDLQDYWDMHKALPDGSRVCTVTEFQVA